MRFGESENRLVEFQEVTPEKESGTYYDSPGTICGINEQVRRNLGRFPPDFMFQLSAEETAVLRSQIATSKQGPGGRRL
ncbi:MAG: ORF6N domain-containing protein [candidate division NC10 bacterium]|nr:ORF6N domain-containing protein [candidate division NC10 bacterium]